MKITGIFKPYEPVEDNLIKDAKTIKDNTGMDIVFLRDSNGELWHEAQYLFGSKTLKIVFDENGVIIMFAEDATFLNPVNCAVAEVSKKNVPAGLDVSQQWVFVDGKIRARIYSDEENRLKAETERKEIIERAMSKIAVIQLKLQAGRKITDSEVTVLNATLDYIDAIEAFDISTYPVKWPEAPSDVA